MCVCLCVQRTRTSLSNLSVATRHTKTMRERENLSFFSIASIPPKKKSMYYTYKFYRFTLNGFVVQKMCRGNVKYSHLIANSTSSPMGINCRRTVTVAKNPIL